MAREDPARNNCERHLRNDRELENQICVLRRQPEKFVRDRVECVVCECKQGAAQRHGRRLATNRGDGVIQSVPVTDKWI